LKSRKTALELHQSQTVRIRAGTTVVLFLVSSIGIAKLQNSWT